MSNIYQYVKLEKMDNLISAVGSGGPFYAEEYYGPQHYTNVKQINVKISDLSFKNGEASVDITQYIPPGYSLSNCINSYFLGLNNPYYLWVNKVTGKVITLYCWNIENNAWYDGNSSTIILSFIVYK